MIRHFNALTVGAASMLPGFSFSARIAFTIVNAAIWGVIAATLLTNGWWFIGSMLVATSVTTALYGVRIWLDEREDERSINKSVRADERGWYGIRVGCRRCGTTAHILDPRPSCPTCGFAGGEP